MELGNWLVYLLAVIGLSMSPGPNGLLALSHGAIYGPSRALYTVAGSVIGFILIVAVSMAGIGALLETSSSLLLLLKVLGGAYLVFLGIQLWRSPAIAFNQQAFEHNKSNWSLCRQGLITSSSNPKVILFFSAFLPQFIDSEKSLVIQFFVMVTTLVVVEVLVEFSLALLANRLRSFLERSGRIFNKTCGLFFAAIGVSLPLNQ